MLKSSRNQRIQSKGGGWYAFVLEVGILYLLVMLIALPTQVGPGALCGRLGRNSGGKRHGERRSAEGLAGWLRGTHPTPRVL